MKQAPQASAYPQFKNQPQAQYPRPPPPLHMYPSKERKIVSNTLGKVYAAVLILVCIMGLVLGIWQMKSFINQTPGIDAGLVTILYHLGTVHLIFIGNPPTFSFEYKILLSSFVAYLLLNLVQMYLPIRALIQPSFAAGKPDIKVRFYFIITFK